MPELRVIEPARPTALEGLVEDYLASCRARGLSPKTIRDNYGYALKSVFLPWAATEGITEPEHISGRVLDRFTAHLLEHGGVPGAVRACAGRGGAGGGGAGCGLAPGPGGRGAARGGPAGA